MQPIIYNNYTLEVREEPGNFEVGFRLLYTELPNEEPQVVWTGIIRGLWDNETERETENLRMQWEMHSEGDYYQHTIIRKNHEILINVSFTAIFQEIIRNNRQTFSFINNLYSTSTLDWLSDGSNISIDAIRFWDRQVEANLAIEIPEEGRFLAIL